MDLSKQLGKAVEQATSDIVNENPLNLYEKILGFINSRVDMAKNTVNAISKRLSYKNKNILYQCFDLLEYLSFRCELALFNQISTKEFLLKISGLLMSQDIDPIVHQKILQTVRCWEELFRPHQDLLPMYFQFYAGILRKQFPIQTNYVSPHRPKDFKVYKKTETKKTQQNKQKGKKVVQPTKSEQKTFQEIREKLLLTNEIIDNANPADNIKNNEILLEMMEEVKASQKKINQTINENPNESIMELALALNDDIFITYRRFKELQKNRKPEPFILTELQSEIIKDKQNVKKKQEKIFEQIPKNVTKAVPKAPQRKEVKQTKAPQKEIDIFDIACEPKKAETTIHSIIDLDLNMTQSTQRSSENQGNIFDFLGSQPKEVPKAEIPSPNIVQQGNYMGNYNFNSIYMNPQQPSPYQSNTFNSNMPVQQPVQQQHQQVTLNQNPVNLGALNMNNENSPYGTTFGNIEVNNGEFMTDNDFKMNKTKNMMDELIDMTKIFEK